MTITVKSRTNVFIMLTTNIWWIFLKKDVHIVQENMANITHFLLCYSTKYK